MAVLYICGFSGDLPVIPCSDENSIGNLLEFEHGLIFVLFFYSQFFENRRRGAVRRRQGQRPSGAGKAAGTSRQ